MSGVAVVVPAGPGAYTLLDTLDSVEVYCSERLSVIVVDDCTGDGTYEALLAARKASWEVLRNERPYRIERLVHTLCKGFRAALATDCSLVLRLDQDALLIKAGLGASALDHMQRHPRTGLFGVYDVDYDRPRNFESHRKLMCRESSWIRRRLMAPSWIGQLDRAEKNGYRRGENVFGGAYFITRPCLEALAACGALDVPWHWHSRMQEDVYFSMTTVAAGFELGHFAAPSGPLCMEWRGLPLPPRDLLTSPYGLVHSVDKGKHTTAAENDGMTARQVFRAAREHDARAAAAGRPIEP